jgi:hypothetical protein
MSYFFGIMSISRINLPILSGFSINPIITKLQPETLHVFHLLSTPLNHNVPPKDPMHLELDPLSIRIFIGRPAFL